VPKLIKVFVSYAWKVEETTQIVEELEKLCRQRGIQLIRDNNALKHGDSIKTFMKELGKGDHVITIFSKAYFESKWCMYELLRIYNRGDFAEKTHPIIADDYDLQNSGNRLETVSYWEKLFNQEKAKLASYDPLSVIPEQRRVKIYQEIYQKINEILDFAADRLTTPLVVLHAQNYTQLLDRIKPHPITLKSFHPDERISFIDRTVQWDNHIERRIKSDKTRKTLAFVIAGIKEEWPEALQYRLRIHLNIKKEISITRLEHHDGNAAHWENSFWSSLLESFPDSHLQKESGMQQIKAQLVSTLSASPAPLFFSCLLDPYISKHLDFVRFIAQRWESLELTDSKHQHFLLIVYSIEEKGNGWWPNLKYIVRHRGDQKVEKWRKKLAVKMSEKHIANIVVPKMNSPTRQDVNYWSKTMLNDDEQTKFDEALARIKGSKIPLLTLKNTYKKIISQT
jgi:TIR domain